MRRAVLIAMASAAALLAMLPAQSFAWRHPTKGEREAILYAGELHNATCSTIQLPCVSYIHVSTKGPWAAEYVGPPSGNHQWQGGIASFRRVGHRWRFHSISQDGQRCGAPPAVQLDLHIYCGNAP